MASGSLPKQLTEKIFYAAIYEASQSVSRPPTISIKALKKLIAQFYGVAPSQDFNNQLKAFLKEGINNGILIQVSGKGASGSIRLSRSAQKEIDKLILNQYLNIHANTPIKILDG